MVKGKFSTILCTWVWVCLVGGMGLAQVTTGTISGTVKDSTGAVLPGTKVVVLNQETGIARTVQADAAGHYSAPSLGLGNYQVTAGLEGFQTEVHKGIVLTVGREAIVDFQLSVGAMTQTVEVTGEAPLVESTTSSLGSLVDDRTIRDLPLNGRSFDQLALLQPGVIAMGGGTVNNSFLYGTGRRFSVAGGRSDTNGFLLDGTDINDHSNSTPGGAGGTNMGVDTIGEFKILTNAFSAEYGRAAGAITSAVTRSGTNEFHGSAFEFIRNSRLDARNFFDAGSSPPPFKRNQFGGVWGGPIQKDKTFFFTGYEGLRQGLGTTRISTVPALAARQGFLPGGVVVPVNPSVVPFLGLYPPPNGRDFGDGTAEFSYAPTVVTNQDYFLGRVDHQLNEKTSVFGRYSFDNDGVNSPDQLPGFATITKGRRQYSTIQANSVLSPTVLNHFHFAYNRSYQIIDDLPTISLGPQFSFIPGLPIGAINVGGAVVGAAAGAGRTLTTIGTNNSTPRMYAYNLFEWGDDFSVIKGKHSLKSGVNIRRLRENTSGNTSLKGQYTFTTFNNLLTAQPSNLQAVAVGQNAYRGFRQTMEGVYVQDDVSVSSRLTLNLGLRWEATTDPTEVNGMISNLLSPSDPQATILGRFFSIGKKNLDPRVGFAWRLNESGKTVLRAGAGIFHNHVLPYVYALNVSKIPPFYSLLSASNPSFPNGYQQLGTGGRPQIFTVASRVKELAKYQYNLSIQQQIAKDTVVEVAYVGSKANHIFRFGEQNTPVPTLLPDGRKCFNFISGGNPNPLCPNGATARQNPNFDTIRVFYSDANSLYNGVTITLKQKSFSGVQYQVFYTFSKAMDTISSTAGGDSTRDAPDSLDPGDPGRDWGPSDFNAKHNLVFSFTYPLPLQVQSKALGAVLGGWSINGIGTFTTGQPFTLRLPLNQSRNGDLLNPDRPDLKPGANNNPIEGRSAGCGGVIPAGQKLRTPDRWYDPCGFQLPLAGTYGNLGRNTVIGPGVANLDLSIEKSFPLRENTDVAFRAEFFNIINHANFGLPNTAAVTAAGLPNASAGRITGTLNSSRQIQFGLKISF